MDLGLTGQRALVSASSGGIGERIARRLAIEGARVIVNGRTELSVDQALKRLRTELPEAQLDGLVADLGTAEGVHTAIERVPAVDILVNNLGVYEAASILEEDDDKWFRLFEINIMSGVRLSRHYLPRMIEQNRGRVLFIGSEAALAPAPELPHYSATKTMDLAVARILAEETKGTAVTVNTLLPGSTRTDGVRAFVQDLFPELPYEEAERRFMAENRSTSMLGRLIDPDEIADIAAFLSSQRSAAFNGAALRADGGIVRSVF